MPVAVHTRETSHLSVLVSGAPTALNPHNYEDSFGTYYETFVKDGDIRVRRSNHAVPPFTLEVQITSSGSASYPWAYMLSRKRLVLLYQDAGPGVYLTTSDDEAATWETPTLAIAGGSKPYGVVSQFDGCELIGAFIAASGKISAQRREVGELAYGAAFFLKDSLAVDLLFEDDTFSWWWGYSSTDPLVGHFHIQGEAATSTWVSYDSGTSWERLT